MSAMALVLAIDGGGSKTACAVARDGAILAEFSAGPSNLVRISLEEARKALLEAMHGACQAAGVSLSELNAVCAGLAGVGHDLIRDKAEEILRSELKCPFEVIGDMEIAFDGAFMGGPGLVVIAGTGSIAYGRNERQDSARAGGWGSVISDEGSGYWIGRRAVSLCLRAIDTGQTTSLVHHILNAWHFAMRDDLVAFCNSQPPPNFAELFPVVLETALAGDTVAQELLTDAGSELAKLAKIVVRKLWPVRVVVQVALAGGVFQNSAVIRQVFENSLRSERPDVRVRMSAVKPLRGALYRAEKLATADPR